MVPPNVEGSLAQVLAFASVGLLALLAVVFSKGALAYNRDRRRAALSGQSGDFRNTVIIMTSNIGSHHLLDRVTPHGEIKPEARTAEPDRAAT